MAASSGLKNNLVVKVIGIGSRLLKPNISCSTLSSRNVSHAKKEQHKANFQRTKKAVQDSLRPKPNFLHYDLVDEHRSSPLQRGTEALSKKENVVSDREFRFIMPEFLPTSDFRYRDRILEKLERQDMLRRRVHIEIPEFYVGSIMAATVSDPHAPGKQNRFVGICIDRGGYGLKAYFVLRNIVEGLGVEVMYKMYNPTVRSIEVLKLEKRLDDRLYFLRNCDPQYSTFDFNMEPVNLPRGAPVPVNTIKVKMNPPPWDWRWELFDLKGIEPLDLTRRQARIVQKNARPWLQHDLMREYRHRVDDEEEQQIAAEVNTEKQNIESTKKVSRSLLRPKLLKKKS